jgi:hypothetical protein
MTTRLVRFAVIAALSVATRSFAQEPVPEQATMHYGVIPWTGGTIDDAVNQTESATTIPMSSFTYSASKDGSSRKVVIVGSNPFGSSPHKVTINAVLIPVVVEILTSNGSISTFDPTAANPCDGGTSGLISFIFSPLNEPSSLTFNGVNVGSHQYIDGFMRAEFWHKIHATGYSDFISWGLAPTLTLPPVPPGFGKVVGTGCSELGVVSSSFLDLQINSWITILQAQGVISPTQFAAFVFENVVESSVTPPTFPKNCCTGGYHSVTGSPAQTFGIMEYDTNGHFGGVHDISVMAHEIGEWMNDPLGNNPTPAWGHIGQTSGCQTNFEVGDPLSQIDMPVIALNGYNYHVQELAFFSWFYNAPSTASLGAGGKFSGNGTFKGPSKPCPPGGTF